MRQPERPQDFTVHLIDPKGDWEAVASQLGGSLISLNRGATSHDGRSEQVISNDPRSSRPPGPDLLGDPAQVRLGISGTGKTAPKPSQIHDPRFLEGESR